MFKAIHCSLQEASWSLSLDFVVLRSSPIMAELILLLLTIVPSIFSFPFVANQPGVDSSLLKRSHNGKRTSNCPVIINRKGAAPFNSKFPYTGARNGLPGSQLGGFEVPNDDDTAHFFEAPGPNDIRGPCPGLNTAANHHVWPHISLG